MNDVVVQTKGRVPKTKMEMENFGTPPKVVPGAFLVIMWFTSRIKDPWSWDWGSLILDCRSGFEIALRGFEILGFIVLGFLVLGIDVLGSKILGFLVLGIVVLGSKILGFSILILRKEDPLGIRILNPCFKDFSSWQSLQLLVILFCVTCAWITIENGLGIWSLSMPPVLLTDWSPPKFSEKWHSAKQPNQSL